jgi:hypothetical protein
VRRVLFGTHTIAVVQNHALRRGKLGDGGLVAMREEALQQLAVRQPGTVVPKDGAAKVVNNLVGLRRHRFILPRMVTLPPPSLYYSDESDLMHDLWEKKRDNFPPLADIER